MAKAARGLPSQYIRLNPFPTQVVGELIGGASRLSHTRTGKAQSSLSHVTSTPTSDIGAWIKNQHDKTARLGELLELVRVRVSSRKHITGEAVSGVDAVLF